MLNGFTSVSRKQEEEDKSSVSESNEIVILFPTSFLQLMLFFFISHSLSEYIPVILIQLPVSQWCCEQLSEARNDSLPRIRHGAGIYQAAEQENLDKSDMCEHASVYVFFFFISCFLCLISQYSCFHSNTISFSITVLQKEL